MIDKYISKAEAIKQCGFGMTSLHIANNLRKMPPAKNVVQVVRCKDCKYNATTHKCLNPDSFFLIPKDDDFCSYGKTR